MTSVSLRVLLVCLLLGISCVAGKLFNSRGSWLKPRASFEEEKPLVVPRCIALRGGASEKPSEGEKIKGVCIGIDLGTTTR